MNQPKKSKTTATKMTAARAMDRYHIQIEFEAEGYNFARKDLQLDGQARIRDASANGRIVTITTTELDYRQNYFLRIKNYGQLPVDLGILMDELYSEARLGFTVADGQTTFRLFAPRATRVALTVFERHNSRKGEEFEMRPSEQGIWEISVDGERWGYYYGYRVSGPKNITEYFEPAQVIADPYSISVVSKNTYRHQARSHIIRTHDYDWEGDSFIKIAWEDLIIYELHVRDMTAHPSAGAREAGAYRGLVEAGSKGGFDHIRELGVNAVELLPCHEFGNIEIPYKAKVEGQFNTWNPYERNHWGYMTSYFFAPESYYSSGGSMTANGYCGVDGRQIAEFKDMVKAFHKAGIAVILDVVYNHVSQYDWNPFKYIDKKYYFRLDAALNFTSFSGCGNDFKSERKMARRLILDSVRYWMQEYHLDGFRFDLAAMLDWETIEAITHEARKINPGVILIAEPWGGGKYDLRGFSERGWAAWNDLFRNGVKGWKPETGQSWIFGKYWGDNSQESLKRYITGSTGDYGGPFVEQRHSLNYLESHDDHTLGDFIRIGCGEIDPHQPIANPEANAKLSEKQLRLNKLAAAFLLTSQGPVMIGEGQEFARSKVIAKTEVDDPNQGRIDHNSYNKDNETNWLNYEHKDLNRELVDYYVGLIELRKAHPAFRRTPASKIRFLSSESELAIGYHLKKDASGDNLDFLVLFNGDPDRQVKFELPAGFWRTVVDANRASATPFGELRDGKIVVDPSSALILGN